MESSDITEYPFEPFVLLTSRLIILPTPHAVSLDTYRTLYASLHADTNFCQVAFGHHFPARNWSDDETREVIETRDIARSWKKHGLGDFALGRCVSSETKYSVDDENHSGISILEGVNFEDFAGPDMQALREIEWIGYAGLRDASTTSLPPREPGDPELPPWNEMIELRYGLTPKVWGGGLAKEAANAIMQWSIDKRGVKRFIAETERDNQRSGRLLQKLGFVVSETNYWKEPSEIEWELVVGRSV
ncbi:hypothetical protein N7462_002702 [Penicillium macrosclerotiorum]|uniref:uncharacterized protein n=1 Tax=Penicillium macrosclerotiorum TaxID=303699 RepID=UPI002548B05E|nr:uncharacterized protein N7462_002702 [Penicillium macrosclerotiorum]KAJ5693279.1 hypothetical protein N7462_002702 [Penicillium macrosclerotiorum]